MYSAVLMLAVTAGAETVDFGRNRCHGCSASCTTVVAQPVVVQGACTNGCHARPRLFGHRCHGATACTTTTVVATPACCAAANGCVRSHGCHGGGLLQRLFHRGHGCTAPRTCAATCATTVIEQKKSEEVKPPMQTRVVTPAPATVIVSLPANARLIVDGNVIGTQGELAAQRTLVTPDLVPGATFVYTMRAEVEQNGRTVAQTQEVRVRGGQTSAVQFAFPTGEFASR